jgi:hypothetical protein
MPSYHVFILSDDRTETCKSFLHAEGSKWLWRYRRLVPWATDLEQKVIICGDCAFVGRTMTLSFVDGSGSLYLWWLRCRKTDSILMLDTLKCTAWLNITMLCTVQASYIYIYVSWHYYNNGLLFPYSINRLILLIDIQCAFVRYKENIYILWRSSNG